MSKLGMYLIRNTDYCAETRNLIEDVINSISSQCDCLSVETKKSILRDALQGMGFSEEQLAAFARDEVPTAYKTVPVNVDILRQYRTYVRVPLYASRSEIKEAAKNQILENGDATLVLDPDLDIEEDDIDVVSIDWEGEQYE